MSIKKKIALLLILFIYIGLVVLYFVNKNDNVQEGKNKDNEIEEVKEDMTLKKENGKLSYVFNKRTFDIPVDKNGFTNILVGGLKTNAQNLNGILALVSINFENKKVVINTFDPRAIFDGVSPKTSYGTALLDGVKKSTGVDIQFFGTIDQHGLNKIINDIYEGVSLDQGRITTVGTGFDVLTRNKGSEQNLSNVNRFLREIIFDDRNRFSMGAYYMVGNEPSMTNMTQSNKDFMANFTIKFRDAEFTFSGNNFASVKGLGYYDFKNGEITEKTKELIEESFK